MPFNYVKTFRVHALNRGHYLARGLVAAWTFNEGAGDIKDASNGLVGTLTNTPTWSTGPYGRELDCVAASNQHVFVGNPAILRITSQISVAASARTNDDPVGVYTIVGKDHDTNGRSYNIDIHGTDGLRWYVNGGASDVLTEGVGPVAGREYFAVGTHTAGDSKLYVDGRQVDSSTLTAGGINDSTANVLLGRREFAGNQDNLNGQLRLVYIWNRVLSAQEVFALYVDPLAFFASNVTALKPAQADNVARIKWGT